MTGSQGEKKKSKKKITRRGSLNLTFKVKGFLSCLLTIPFQQSLIRKSFLKKAKISVIVFAHRLLDMLLPSLRIIHSRTHYVHTFSFFSCKSSHRPLYHEDCYDTVCQKQQKQKGHCLSSA